MMVMSSRGWTTRVIAKWERKRQAAHVSPTPTSAAEEENEARKERTLLCSAVPSLPTKTVRVRPALRPNLPESSDDSEGGLLEAFRERRAREEQLGNVEAEAGVTTAHPMTVEHDLIPPPSLRQDKETPPLTHDDSDDDDSSSSSFDDDDNSDNDGCEYQRLVRENISRNKARLAKLRFNDNLETKKTNKTKSAPRFLPPDGPRRRNPVRSNRAMTINESTENDEYGDEVTMKMSVKKKANTSESSTDDDECDDDESIAEMKSKSKAKDLKAGNEESSERGVPCAAPPDKEVEGSSEGGMLCAAPSDVMNADIVRVPPMSNLDEGSRVLVDYKGKLYNATIRKHRIKFGKQEFQIHYDGNKKSTLYWIPVDHIKSSDIAREEDIYDQAHTIQPSNQPDEDSPLTITTGIDLVSDVGASPGISIYTILSGPSPERNSIYDN